MIIAISGKIGAGKDTVGEIIQYLTSPNAVNKGTYEECKENSYVYDVKFENKKFAGKLKDMVCLLLGCTREKLEDREFKESELGEEWRRYFISYYKLKTTKNTTGRVSKLLLRDNVEEELQKISELMQISKDSLKVESDILTPRLLLQLLGTNCGRDILHPNLWVNSTMVDYKSLGIAHYQDGERVLFTPERPNEVVTPKDKDWRNKWGIKPKNDTFKEKEIFPNWIITDMRFPNEAQAVVDRDGLVIRVERPIIVDFGNEYVDGTYVNETHRVGERIEGTTKYKMIPLNEHSSETGLDEYDNWNEVILNDGTISELVEKIRLILKKYNII